MSERKPLVICGPSGVGKGTLIKELQQRLPDTLLGLTVSDTTRSPRKNDSLNEVDGVHYNFITKEEFKAKLKRDMYIEHKEYAGNLYGTSYQAVVDVHVKSLICLMEIHVTSAQYIKYNKPDLKCNYVFVSTSNGLTTLEERLRRRGSESEEKVQSRLAAAAEEFEFVEKNAAFFDAIIYNDDAVEHTLENLMTQLNVWYPDLIRSPGSSGSVGSSGQSAATTPQRGVSLIGKPCRLLSIDYVWRTSLHNLLCLPPMMVLLHSTESKKCGTTRRKDQRYTLTMNVFIIKTKTETDAAVQRMRHATCVGFDCEGIGALSCFDKISLILISAEQTIYFFDISKMCCRIPRSPRLWLTSAECTKCIHDSRQDQDALYHQYGTTLQCTFDTSVAGMVHRTWLGKSKQVDRLSAMNPVAKNCIRNVRDYMVNFVVEEREISPSIPAQALRQRSRRNEPRKELQTTDLPAIDEQIAAAAAHATRGRPFHQAGAGKTKVKTKTTEQTQTKTKTNVVQQCGCIGTLQTTADVVNSPIAVETVNEYI